MSVADRLTKLTTDITNAYTSIENKGGTTPANKNTNNLSTAIDSIEVIEQATAEGESLNLTNTKAMPYSDYVVEGKSEQETRSGKNLLNVTATSRTYDGTLSVTVNDDKSITLNGTNTSGETIYYRLGDNFTLSVGTYTLSNHNDNCNPSSTYGFYDDENNFDRTKTSTKTFSNTVTIKPYIRINAGITVNNQTIYPMIEQGSSMTDYEQYGVTPSPEYPSEIHSVADDVNLLNLENIENHSVNSYYYENIGTNFQLKAGETYTLSFDAESDITPFNVGIGCGSSGNYQSDILVKDGFQNGRISITFTPQNSNFTYGNYLAVRFVKYNNPTSYTYSARNIKLQKGTVTIKQRGKNLFDLKSYLTDRSVTYTENTDGSLTFSTTINLYSNTFTFSSSNTNVSLSGIITNGTATNGRIQLLNSSNVVVGEITSSKISYENLNANQLRFNYSTSGTITLKNIQLEERLTSNRLRTISSQRLHIPNISFT